LRVAKFNANFIVLWLVHTKKDPIFWNS
jgi:hypothetical protein